MIKTDDVSVDTLRELLDFDLVVGRMWWKTRLEGPPQWNTRWSGEEAFTAKTNGYRCGRIFNRTYTAHRVLWALSAGAWPVRGIDHLNGDRSDNRLINLREANQVENMRNRGSQKGSSSRCCGVSWHELTSKWMVRIKFNGKQTYIGIYDCEFEAACAYDRAALEHHGEFAHVNF